MAGKLLRAPNTSSSSSDRSEVRFARASADYVNLSEGFKQTKRDFQRQYFDIYAHRLKELRPRVEADVRGRKVKAAVTALCDLDGVAKDTQVVLVGTVAKQQALRPSILKELADDNGLQPQPANSASRARFVSDDDELVLEDDTQRIKLRGDVVQADKMPTGIVVGVLGSEKESGKFFVTEIFYPATEAQPERPIPEKDR